MNSKLRKTIRIASIDIGRVNFAQYVEEFDVETILNLEKRYKKLPKKLQRRVKGNMNQEISAIIDELSVAGTRITTGVYSFTDEANQSYDNRVRLTLLSHLNYFEHVWDECDIIVIEQQFYSMPKTSKRSKVQNNNAAGANVAAIQLGEAVYMYFFQKYGNLKHITYFPSEYKTHILGAPVGLNKTQRKQWSTEFAEQIYSMRNDQDMINVYALARDVKRKQFKTEKRIREFRDIYACESDDAKILCDKVIREKQKLDDISDALNQLLAYIFRTMIACF